MPKPAATGALVSARRNGVDELVPKPAAGKLVTARRNGVDELVPKPAAAGALVL